MASTPSCVCLRAACRPSGTLQLLLLPLLLCLFPLPLLFSSWRDANVYLTLCGSLPRIKGSGYKSHHCMLSGAGTHTSGADCMHREQARESLEQGWLRLLKLVWEGRIMQAMQGSGSEEDLHNFGWHPARRAQHTLPAALLPRQLPRQLPHQGLTALRAHVGVRPADTWECGGLAPLCNQCSLQPGLGKPQRQTAARLDGRRPCGATHVEPWAKPRVTGLPRQMMQTGAPCCGLEGSCPCGARGAAAAAAAGVVACCCCCCGCLLAGSPGGPACCFRGRACRCTCTRGRACGCCTPAPANSLHCSAAGCADARPTL